jgi:hypothetical protein
MALACSRPQPNQIGGPEGAALNVGLGVAAAPLHRAATGCFTPCAYGTVCDDANGVCVAQENATGSTTVDAPAAASGSAAPSAAPSAPGAPVASTSAAPPSPPVCTPACKAGELCVVDAGKPACKPAAR